MARQKLFYHCTEQFLQEQSGRIRRTYKLNVLDISAGTDQARLLCTVDDVCGSESQARLLENLLYRNQVAPKHIVDVIENWLP